ncbi:type 1 fimbrial protein [Pantoea sp. LS15]|uniref:fimbrial protein n=1 Tax=Enterobacterales TaxID=91347 RepID=UPI000E0F7C52|nr:MULTISPECIES: fimbrial protein [Enterobacterales]NJQ21815.1 type 1 fimbrial protein [Pantoea sp. LS15]NKF48411.1 type 1 fimbrial protein [Pantoea sp. LS15]RDK12969.1 type 1 fimbrial protein [Enterobacter sp. 9-2]
MKITNSQRLLAAALLLTACGAAADNMAFSGTLRAQACTLHPDDALISVKFDGVGTRDLYLNGGTDDERFTIRLLNCNRKVAGSVETTFLGHTNTKIPGSLALDSGSKAGGFAIMFKDAARNSVKIGEQSASPLTEPDTELVFYRRLQVEPDALVTKGITPGHFTANASFELYYP